MNENYLNPIYSKKNEYEVFSKNVSEVNSNDNNNNDDNENLHKFNKDILDEEKQPCIAVHCIAGLGR